MTLRQTEHNHRMFPFGHAQACEAKAAVDADSAKVDAESAQVDAESAKEWRKPPSTKAELYERRDPEVTAVKREPDVWSGQPEAAHPRATCLTQSHTSPRNGRSRPPWPICWRHLR
jgi:hypothetical protein